jgi:hypothetical protein
MFTSITNLQTFRKNLAEQLELNEQEFAIFRELENKIRDASGKLSSDYSQWSVEIQG